MPITGDYSEDNVNNTESFSITAFKEYDSGNTISATGFANDVRKEYDPFKPVPPYANAGLNLGIETSGGSVGLTAKHVHNRADVLTASTNIHLVNDDTHKLTANAHTTTVIPKAGPTFNTHGGGVDYTFKNRVGANASVSHTPMYKQTDYSMGGRLNLHQTPDSSLNFNVGANKTVGPFGRRKWEPGCSIMFKKSF